MASSYRIKGITVEIGGDTTNLYKSLREVNDEIKETQKELKDVERLLKLDPTNVELLTQKQKLLAQAVEETAEKEKTLEEATKQATEQLKAGKIDEKQYNALKVELEGARKEAENARRAYAEFNPVLERVSETAKKVSDGLSTAAEKTRGLSTAAGIVAGSLVAATGKAAQYADDLLTLSQQSGFSTETLQRWEYASELVDVSVEDIISSARKLKKNMESNSADVVAAWDTLGISVKDASGQYKDAEVVFYDVLRGLSMIPNETERDIVAMQLFGKNADALAGIIDDGGDALRAYGDEAAALGLVLDEKALQGADDFSDGLYKLKIQAEKTFINMGSNLAEQLLPQLEKLVGKLGDVFEWIANLDGDRVLRILKIAGIIAVVSPLLTMLSEIVNFIKIGIDLVPKLAAALSLSSPQLLLIAGAVTALAIGIAAIINAWDDMTDFEKIISVLGALAIAAAGAAIAVGALQSAWSLGIAAAAIVAGIVAIATAVSNAEKRAKRTNAGYSVNGMGGGNFGNADSIVNGINASNQLSMQTVPSQAYGTGVPYGATVTEEGGVTRTSYASSYNAAPETKVNIEFNGDLAGLARVLQPAIKTETARAGTSAAR